MASDPRAREIIETLEGPVELPLDWFERQPEPTSDCEEAGHYVMLFETGQCPYCGLAEVR